VEFLEVFCKGSNNRTWLFIRLKGRAALLRPLGNVSVTKSGREETAHILHEKHARFNNVHEAKELPKQRTARILNSLSPASRTEGLAGRTTNEQIKFPWLDAEFSKDFVGVKSGNIAFKDSKVSGEPTSVAIQSNRFTKGVFLFHASANAESSGLFKAEV
jgi:hypothetical protein